MNGKPSLFPNTRYEELWVHCIVEGETETKLMGKFQDLKNFTDEKFSQEEEAIKTEFLQQIKCILHS